MFGLLTLLRSLPVAAVSSLGRFQRGDRVVVDVPTTILPDSHPVCAVMASGGGSVGAFVMAFNPDIPGFRVTLRLGPEYGLGIYNLTVTYAVAGMGYSVASAFEVVAGSDPSGPIISLYSYDRPEGRYVLAQLGGGRLTQGRNPKL